MQQTTQIDTDTIQEAIIKEFKTLEGDQESKIAYIMELGERLPPMSAAEKIENNTVKGCLSTVWLTYTKKDDLLFFKADSNTAITRGLISLLLRVLSGQNIDTIINTNLFFAGSIDMFQLIGSQRAGGFASMLKTIRLIAIAQKDAQEAALAKQRRQ